MNLRKGNKDGIFGRRRDSEDMLPCPSADKEVIEYLQKEFPRHLVHVESWLYDTARLQHSHWCHAGDWHVSGYEYYVDEDTKKVYIVVDI